jgi:hypothetical protein
MNEQMKFSALVLLAAAALAVGCAEEKSSTPAKPSTIAHTGERIEPPPNITHAYPSSNSWTFSREGSTVTVSGTGFLMDDKGRTAARNVCLLTLHGLRDYEIADVTAVTVEGQNGAESCELLEAKRT